MKTAGMGCYRRVSNGEVIDPRSKIRLEVDGPPVSGREVRSEKVRWDTSWGKGRKDGGSQGAQSGGSRIPEVVKGQYNSVCPSFSEQ